MHSLFHILQMRKWKVLGYWMTSSRPHSNADIELQCSKPMMKSLNEFEVWRRKPMSFTDQVGWGKAQKKRRLEIWTVYAAGREFWRGQRARANLKRPAVQGWAWRHHRNHGRFSQLLGRAVGCGLRNEAIYICEKIGRDISMRHSGLEVPVEDWICW